MQKGQDINNKIMKIGKFRAPDLALINVSHFVLYFLHADIESFDLTYYDNPNVRKWQKSFKAELSVIKIDVAQGTGNNRKNNTYTPKVTLSYGFSVTNGKVTLSPIRVVRPSLFQKQTINSLGK